MKLEMPIVISAAADARRASPHLLTVRVAIQVSNSQPTAISAATPQESSTEAIILSRYCRHKLFYAPQLSDLRNRRPSSVRRGSEFSAYVLPFLLAVPVIPLSLVGFSAGSA